MENHYPLNITQKTDGENIADVKVILRCISKLKFAYDENSKSINFDLAIEGLSIDDRIQLTETLKSISISKNQNTEEIISTNLALYLDVFYRTIPDLKKVAKYGNAFYEIIVRYYIEREFDNINEAAKSIDGIGSRATFIRRSNEACLRLYTIWFCTGLDYISSVLNEIIYI